MSKMKTLKIDNADQYRLLEQERASSLSNNQMEYGVPFAVTAALSGTKAWAILFREPTHTRKQVQIAAARINALHFFDAMYVADMDQAGDFAV